MQDCVYCCWTDSMIALSWIRSHSSRWKTFMANRVAEIQSLTSSDIWFHCPGSENPVDLLTRGLTANVWLHRPTFLLQDPAEFQFELCEEITASGPVEETSAHICISSEKPSVVFEIERWGLGYVISCSMSDNRGHRDGLVKWPTGSSKMLGVWFSRRSRNRSFLMNCGLWGKVSLCPNRRLYSSWLLTLLTMVCCGWREDYSSHNCPLTRSIPFFSRNVIWQFYYDSNMCWWNMLVYRRWSLP